MVRYAPVSRDRHGQVRILPAADRRYAASVAVVPVITDEIGMAAAYYPLAFGRLVDGGPPVACAVLGLDVDRNLFVDPAGRWRGGYIPALLRRYPFMLAPGEAEGAFVVCIDEESGLLSDSQGDPLFDASGGKAPYLDQVGAFLGAIQGQALRMEAIGQQLEAAGVLAPLALRARPGLPMPDDKLQAGLMRIDEAKLSALSDAAFLELRQTGALTIAYAQLATTGQWERLSALGKLAADEGRPTGTPSPAGARPAPAPGDADWVLSFD